MNAPYSFKTTIDDPSAKTIAVHDDGTPAAAERQFSNYKSIVVCHPLPDAVFLRGLLGRQGVRVWASGKSGLDQTNFAGPLISIYSKTGGQKTIWLPEKVEIAADLFSGQILGQNIDTIHFTMPARPHTIIIYAGNQADYQQYFRKR